MVDPETTRIWTYRALYAGLGLIIIFIHIIPRQTLTSAWIAPDLLLCITIAWTIRRPDYVPVLLVVAAFLLSDLFFMRPPGLMTALAIVGAEYLRSRCHLVQEFPFALEWAVVGIIIGVMLLLYRFAHIVVALPPPPILLSMIHFAATLLAYPLIVAISVFGLNIRPLAPGDARQMGNRI